MAEKTLLFRNPLLISEEQKFITALLPKVQSVINELINLNIPYTLDTVTELVNSIIQRPGIETIKEIITNLLVDSIENPKIGSLNLSKEKLKGMIDLPDCSIILNLLTELKQSSYFGGINNIILMYKNYFTINAGIVSKIENIDDYITEKHSFYSENQNQIDLFNKINDFANACNSLEAYLKGRNIYAGMLQVIKDTNIVNKKEGVWIPDFTYISINSK